MTDLDPGEHSVAELEAELESVDSVETLESLLVAEQEGRDRKTAKQAIEARMEAVAGAAAADGGTAEAATADEAETDDGGGTLDGVRSSAAGSASGLVGWSTTLDRLFGEDLSEPAAGTVGFSALFTVLAVGALWTLATAPGGPLLWTVVVTLTALFGGIVVGLAAAVLSDVDASWLGGSIVGTTYFAVGAGLVVFALLVRGLLRGSLLAGFGGTIAPGVAILGLQATMLMLLFEAYSRPVLPAGGSGSLHATNSWRTALFAVAVVLVVVLGVPGWVSGGGFHLAGAGFAWLFLPIAAAAAAVLLHALATSAAVESTVRS